MLDEIKKSYQEYLDVIIPTWKKISKKDLCEYYIQNESNKELADAYFTAIIVKYWSKINTYYNKSKPLADEYNCLEWLFEAVKYALDHRKWKDPENKLYNDPNAEDKVINRVLESRRLTYLQLLNKQKRQIIKQETSLDELQEEYDDHVYSFQYDEKGINDLHIDELVKSQIKNKNYLFSIVLDIIMYGDCFDGNEFNQKKLIKQIHHLDDKYCLEFCKKYDCTYQEAKNNFINISKLTTKQLNEKIFFIFSSLSQIRN